LLKIILYLLSIIYQLIVIVRNKLFDLKLLKSVEFSTPIISVGNLTVGGTGKTPHIEYLAAILSKSNLEVAVLSRGYKRKTKGFRLADMASTVTEIGDEPMQIKQKYPSIEVAVDENRVRGIEKLQSMYKKLCVVLLDDAFQHRYVKPGLSILLTDFHRPYFEDKMLPLGRLRENISESVRAQIIIVSKTPDDIKPIDKRIVIKKIKPYPFQNVYFTSIKYGNLIPVQEFIQRKAYQIELNADFIAKNYQILLITGIANPFTLNEYLKKYSQQIDLMEFADHYQFKPKDIKQIAHSFALLKQNTQNTIIVTTEKDVLRLQNLALKNEFKEMDLPIYYIPIEIEFLDNTKEEFDNQIIGYVRTNKSYDGFFKESI